MKLSKNEELMTLAAALYLIGVEVEASRDRLKELVEKGYDHAAKEIAEEYKEFSRLSKKFDRMEEKYLRLRERRQEQE